MKITGICEAILYNNKNYNIVLNQGNKKIKVLANEKLKPFVKYDLEGDFKSDVFQVSEAKKVVNFKDEYKILSSIIGEVALNNAMSYYSKQSLNKKEALTKLEKLLVTKDTEKLSIVTEFKNPEKIIERFEKNYRLFSTFKELEMFDLSYYEFKHLYRHYKKEDNIYEKIKNDPYDLLYRGNLSFVKCDLIQKYFGGLAESRNRIAKAIWYTLKLELSKGHTYTSFNMLINKVQEFLKCIPYGDKEEVIIDAVEIVEAINELSNTGKIIKTSDNCFYLPKVYNFEKEISTFFHKRTTYNKPLESVGEYIETFEKEKGIKFGSEQVDAIKLSLANEISVITGGAGTGKTSSLACIIYILQQAFDYEDEEICLVAPTGKASRRMSESINKQLGTNFEAKTIHKELKLTPSDDLDMFEERKVNEQVILDKAKVVIVDETSMLDLHTAFELLSAIDENSKIIFLGDIEQLPPVSYGYFLRDIIDYGVPTTKLLQVHRQSGESAILDLSLKIRNETILLKDVKNKPDFGFVSFDDYSFNKKIETICDLFLRSVKDSSIDETMILTPLNDKRGYLSSLELNNAIQEKVLPDKLGETTLKLNGYTFKIGSKVILTKNLNEKKLVNGQIGYVLDITLPNKILIDFEGVEVLLEENELDSLRLGYAITVHKSQGSEWKNCIYICDSETTMNKKNLVYTAITRAKKKLVVCGMKEVFVASAMMKQTGRRSRILKF